MSNHNGNANKMVGEDHLPNTGKMVSDTPRTDAEMVEMTTGNGPVKTRTKWVHSSVCIQLERELNAANERIKRLEEAAEAISKTRSCGCPYGESVFYCRTCVSAWDAWEEAKEAKL